MTKLVLLFSMLFLVACNQEPLTTEPEVTGGPTASAIQASTTEPEVTGGPTDGTIQASQGRSGYMDEWPENIEFDWYGPCVNEVMHGSGTFWVRAHWVTQTHRDGSERWVLTVQMEDDWTLVGTTSGSVWVPAEQMGSHSSVYIYDGDFLIINEPLTFVNQSTGVVLRWPANIHFVYNAQGELVVDRVVGDPCYLIHD